MRNRQIVATGYNGAPAGIKHCTEIGCYREKHNIPSGSQHEKCRATHAEQNAIAQAARYGVSTDGTTAYCTTSPCSICAKILINAGIVKFFYSIRYADKLADEILAEAGITMVHYPISVECIEMDKRNNAN